MGYILRLTRYPLKYKGLFAAYLLAAVVGSVFNVLSPLVIQQIVDVVVPNLEVGTGTTESVLAALLPPAFLYVGLTLMYAVFDILGRYGAALSASKAIYDMRAELYGSLMEKDLEFYDQNETGQLLARVTSDVTTMREFLLWGYRVWLIAAATLVGTYYVMWTLSPNLTLFMLLMAPVTLTFVYLFARRVRPLFKESRDRFGELSSVLAENVVGMKVVKSYAAGKRERERVDVENQKFRDISVTAFRKLAFYEPLLPSLFGMATGFLIYVGGVNFLSVPPELTEGEFVAIVTLVGTLLLPARFLSWGMGMYQRASAAGERTFYILDQKDKLNDPEQPIDVSDFKGDVEFAGVSFSYRGEKFTLDDVSLRIEPGQVVALLGGTGSGKTSVVNLIPRFYDVDDRPTIKYQGRVYPVNENGSVRVGDAEFEVVDGGVQIDGTRCLVRPPGRLLVDGVDVRQYRLDDLRSRIGMVHQDPFLFSASIRDNIAFARPEATDDEVDAAARAAMIHDFIMTLPDKYNTVVGERGVTLSGGQKQRVAIARALLANPKILILDDSTSSVDAKTELQIQQALENLMVGRTTFIITHRLSTIRNAGLIVMMERGRIVEHGTHEELMAAGGLYSSVYETLTEMQLVAESAAVSGGVSSE